MERKRSYKARNREETRARILSVAIAEFTEQGFPGARVENIANRSDVTLRMIYHYFKSKASLYATVLQHVYDKAAEAENAFAPGDCSARDGMRSLVGFAFDHFAAQPELIKLNLGENLLNGEYLQHAGIKPRKNMPLFDEMTKFLKAGQKDGTFHKDVSPEQAWIMICSLCCHYLSQRHTLSWKLDADLSGTGFAESWREQVVRTAMAALAA